MLSKYWLIGLITVGLTVYVAEKADLPLPSLIRFYLNDLIIVPLTALVARTLIRLFFGNKAFILTFQEVLFIVLFYNIVFECILPLYLQRYTADYIDVMMYALGGALYLRHLNRS